MPRYFRNRKSEEVRKLLVAHGYSLVSRKGDDCIYSKPHCQYTVKIPDRNEVIKTGTMDYIKRMIILNGLSRKDILKWWVDNGCGE